MNDPSAVIAEDLQYIGASLEQTFTQMAGKSLLITGGAGFLGYYLVQSVLHWNRRVDEADAIRVTVFDNYIRGMPRWLGLLCSDPHLSLIKGDITKPLPEDLPSFAYITHAASIASPVFYRKYPIETMDANVNGLRSLLEHCRKQQDHPVEGFLFFSTSEIYGDPDPAHIPTPESYRGNVSCTGPRACYDESKRYGETLCVNFAHQYGLPITIARPFNNYGPGLKITDRRVVPDFGRNILAGEDIVLLSDGSPTRTFCYVADAVIGYYKVLVHGHHGESYNIGVESPEVSVGQLAERMVRIAKPLFGYTGRVTYDTSNDQNYLVDNPTRRCPVITKAREHVRYNPTIDLDTGLKRLLVWYSGHRDGTEA